MRDTRGTNGLLAVIVAVIVAALLAGPALPDALAEGPGRPMPNRFLSTSLGWITSQARQDYYPAEIPDQLIEDWKAYAACMKEVGFTSVGPWGFLCNTFPYPFGVDTRSVGTETIRVSSDKIRKTRQIVEMCHARGIEFYYGLCLYFAYWQDFVNACPEAVNPKNKAVMCPTYPGDSARGLPATIELMKQGVDFVMANLPVDGFLIESSHHGRCMCDRCLARFPDTPRGTAEYHRFANEPVFRHIRDRYPKAKILFCPEGPLEVIQRTENLDILKGTLGLCHYFVWCGATQPPEIMRQLAAASPGCGFMFRQEPWQSVPPTESDRDGWFFPNLVNPLGTTIHERSKTMDWAGVLGCGLGRDNPCDNVNLRFLARMQMAPARDPVAVAREVLKEVYTPKNDKALDQLYSVLSESEVKFRQLWPTWFMHIDFMPTGYKFTPMQTVDLIGTYQIALARLRAIRPELGNQAEATRLEASIVKWIGYIKDRLRKDYQYEMPDTTPVTPRSTRPATTRPTRLLVLPVQRRAEGPDGKEVVVKDVWRVPMEEVALVTQHLWNVGEPDGPAVPDGFLVGMGTLRNTLREQRVNSRYILPALRIARHAGLVVVHSQPGFIAHKWPQYKALVAEMTGTPVQPTLQTPAPKAYAPEEKARWTVSTWPGWAYMDFPAPLKPLPSEPVTMTSEELDYVLKKRGIKTLIYVGYATDMCLISYTGGLNDMVKKFGYRACVIREATLATELNDGVDGVEKTEASLERIEREYAATTSAAAFGGALVCVAPASTRPASAPTRSGRHNLLSSHLGWVASVPGVPLYPQEISDQLLADWKAYFAFMNETGWNEVGIWGFLTYNLPVPLGIDTKGIGPHAGDVRISGERLRKCREIIRAAHERSIKLYYGLGIYSWNVQDIGDVYPETRPKGKVLCATYPGNPQKGIPSTSRMMMDAVDFLVDHLDIDGFWVSSADQGRCLCDRCLSRFPNTPRGNLEYYLAADLPVLKHIRAKHPGLTIAYCTEVAVEAMEDPSSFDILTRYARASDIYLWGNLQKDADQTVRRLREACPKTQILFYQRPWQSTPPTTLGRDGWFMPNLVHPLGTEIHRRGGAIPWDGIMGCPMPKDNPADSLSMRYMIRMMDEPQQDPVAVAKELLQARYDPTSPEALDELYLVFDDVEQAFRERWPSWFMHIDRVPGQLGTLDSARAWTVEQAIGYINANQRSLARLRAIMPKLANAAEAARLEHSIITWIRWLRDRVRTDYHYEMP
jgi:nicotinamidase-related amidase